ncbi:MAG: hypothetical protein WC641_06155 [Patescibacteria group bacterium]
MVQAKNGLSTQRLTDVLGRDYRNMELGEILNIQAMDTMTKRAIRFRIQVVHLEIGDNEFPLPTFRFLNGGFSFCGGDGRTPVCVRKGELVKGGFSAGQHVPIATGIMSFVEIAIDNDYSFEFVGGRDETLYAESISEIAVERPPRKWRKPNGLADYLQRAAKTKRALKMRERREEQAMNKVLLASFGRGS